MSTKPCVIAAAAIVVAAAIGAYLYLRPPPAAPVVTQQGPEPPATVAPTPPVPPEPTAAPLPALDASDAAVAKALTDALGKPWMALILPENLIRRVVAMVDNLPRKRPPAAMVLLKRADGPFVRRTR